MARTLSAPQRGSIVAFSEPKSESGGAAFELPAFGGSGVRGLFLLLAALLTGTGAIIPHFSAEFVSTMLFVAGAGLATLVVILPWHVLARSETEVDIPVKLGASAAVLSDSTHQRHFPELLAGRPDQRELDRAVWAKLTAHMSHELRTPLNAVLGFSEIMTKEIFGPLGSSYSAYAQDIHSSGRILLKTAEDALAITALLTASERKSAETCNLKAVVDDASSFASADFAGRSFLVDIARDANAEILLDQQALRQLLVNLIAEANRNSGPESTLRIETNAVSEAIDVRIALTTNGFFTPLDEGFPIILARTLCELCGAELTIGGACERGEWAWTVRLPRAVQPDLFASA
ncbi:HAMP domain-containing sensor histidine kinase [Hyphomicrobium sp.]|uniref:sensor histidine kinase n=1 Tax=Hyphomicrobium sp. TaxID=82 RepID=UPI000FA32678|nr:HAMP domain-containing sensor histidine kinase [Hyphomicrobium sp.]RUO99173.1 MAG: HAMP domain-containing histidine kinase [Hyphomicrobium sp.]